MVKQDLQIRTTRPADAIVEIKHLLKKQRAMMLWGAPGIGKSDIIQYIGDQEGQRAQLEEDEGSLLRRGDGSAWRCQEPS